MDNASEWKNPKHRDHWHATLLGETEDGKKTKYDYCAPIHNVAVGEIDTELVLSVLKPIWRDKPETASRLRGRIEKVIGYAVINGLCGNINPETHQNPARWHGHLELAQPAKGKVCEVKHFAALPYAEVSAFYVKLRQRPGLAARCFELAILCAVRTGDLIGVEREDRPPMRREHVDLEKALWEIPKTKTNVQHRVPLSSAAVALLRRVYEEYPDDGRGIVFAGDRPGTPLSNGTMLVVRNRMVAVGLIEKGTVTVHGISRACFKTWASEETGFPRDVIES